MGLLIDHLRPQIGGDFLQHRLRKLYIAFTAITISSFVRPATATDYIEREDTPRRIGFTTQPPTV